MARTRRYRGFMVFGVRFQTFRNFGEEYTKFAMHSNKRKGDSKYESPSISQQLIFLCYFNSNSFFVSENDCFSPELNWRR